MGERDDQTILWTLEQHRDWGTDPPIELKALITCSSPRPSGVPYIHIQGSNRIHIQQSKQKV